MWAQTPLDKCRARSCPRHSHQERRFCSIRGCYYKPLTTTGLPLSNTIYGSAKSNYSWYCLYSQENRDLALSIGEIWFLAS